MEFKTGSSRRRSIEPAGTVDILVHGEISVVASFITELNVSHLLFS